METNSTLSVILGVVLGFGFLAFFVIVVLRTIWQVVRTIITGLVALPGAMLRVYFFLKEYPSVIAIVSTNLIPLAGVIWFDWSLFSLLMSYWFQSITIGYFSMAKLKRVAEFAPEPQNVRVIAFALQRAGHARPPEIIIREFKGVYIFGLVASFIAIMIITGLNEAGGLDRSFFYKTIPALIREFQGTFGTVAIGAISFLFHHTYSYFSNFIGKSEFQRTTLRRQLEMPLGRVGTIWGATFLAGVYTVALPFGHLFMTLVIFVLLKTLIDVAAHIQEHTGRNFFWKPRLPVYTTNVIKISGRKISPPK